MYTRAAPKVDVATLATSGYRGGSLFNTIIFGEIAYHIAAIVEMGSRNNDVWPNIRVPLEQEAIETLQKKLCNDDQVVVECTHNTDHNKSFSPAVEWQTTHHYGEDSPYTSGMEGWEDWCDVPQ